MPSDVSCVFVFVVKSKTKMSVVSFRFILKDWKTIAVPLGDQDGALPSLTILVKSDPAAFIV